MRLLVLPELAIQQKDPDAICICNENKTSFARIRAVKVLLCYTLYTDAAYNTGGSYV